MIRRLAGVQRLAVAAAVLLQAGGLRARDAEREGGLLLVEPDQPRRSGSRSQGAQGPCEMPAAEVMTRGGLAHPDARFERRRQGDDHVASRRLAPLAEREERRQGGGAGVENHAAEMRVVEVEHVPHLAVGHRRIQQAEPKFAAPQHRDRRHGAQRLERRDCHVHGWMAAAGEGAADPVEQRALRLVHRRGRQVLVVNAREEAGERAGDPRPREGRTIRGLLRVGRCAGDAARQQRQARAEHRATTQVHVGLLSKDVPQVYGKCRQTNASRTPAQKMCVARSPASSCIYSPSRIYRCRPGDVP